MTPCAIALQEPINVCYQYSIETDLNFNANKSFVLLSIQNNIHYRFHRCL